MTAITKGDTMKAPPNQFVHIRAFPDYTFTDVVSPNADTLYSTAWLDLSGGPMILSVPDMGKRDHEMMMMDAWTNVFASPGTRTTGNGKGDFAIVGPGWSGQLPPNIKEIKSPTNMLWLLGRTQTNGASDYPTVHVLQDQDKFTSLSAWGSRYTPPAAEPVSGSRWEDTASRTGGAHGCDDFLRPAQRPHDWQSASGCRCASVGALCCYRCRTRQAVRSEGPRSGGGRCRRTICQGRSGPAYEEAKKPHGTSVNGWEMQPANTADFGTDRVAGGRGDGRVRREDAS